MNTIQIEQTLASVPYFKGVYPCDQLPSKFTLPAIFIFNHDPGYLSGTHWSTIAISDNGLADYMDSYGLPPLQQEIKYFLRLHSKHQRYNKKRLQSMTSNVCGHYACIFALYRAVDLSMKDFTDEFSSNDFCHNDQIVMQLFEKYFGTCPTCKDEGDYQSCVSEMKRNK